RSRSTESAISIGEVIQPRRSAIVVCTAASRLHTDGSRFHNPSAARAATSSELFREFTSGPADTCSDLSRRARRADTSSAGHRVSRSWVCGISLEYRRQPQTSVESLQSKVESRQSKVVIRQSRVAFYGQRVREQGRRVPAGGGGARRGGEG